MYVQLTGEPARPIKTISAWQCIGCGTIEAPKTCIGVCQDRHVEFVHAARHAHVVAELEATRRERGELQRLVRTLASSRPRDGEWERSHRALQAQARALMLRTAGGTSRPDVAA